MPRLLILCQRRCRLSPLFSAHPIAQLLQHASLGRLCRGLGQLGRAPAQRGDAQRDPMLDALGALTAASATPLLVDGRS
jgi:hypothetical protein